MIKIIDSLYLTEKGCSIKKRNYHPVHIRQGDIDGACAVYSLMMNLLILKTISRVQIEDVYDNEEFYKLKYCSTVVYMVPRA